MRPQFEHFSSVKPTDQPQPGHLGRLFAGRGISTILGFAGAGAFSVDLTPGYRRAVGDSTYGRDAPPTASPPNGFCCTSPSLRVAFLLNIFLISNTTGSP